MRKAITRLGRPLLAGAAVVMVLSACATPGRMRSADASDLARLEAGMSVKEARRAVRTRGEPVALFLDKGQRCEIRKYTARETGAPYYVLWIEDKLRGVVPADKGFGLEAQSPRQANPSALPHAEGFQVLLEPFSNAVAPNSVDFARPREGYRPRDKELERAEMVMWAPLVLFLLPVMPLQLASVGKAAAGHGPYYALDLGWSPEQVRRNIGKPNAEQGDPSEYGVWSYRYEPYEFDELSVSIGFRRNAVEWVRYGYYADTTEKENAKVD